MQLTTVLALFATLLPVAMADCCGPVKPGPPPFDPGYCGDGSRPTPCCAYGPCNIFCCNCDNGCRQSTSLNRFTLSRLHTERASDAELFERARGVDTGELTLRQYSEYMGVAINDPVYVNWFYRHDRNGDGVLTVDELRLQGD